MPVLLTVLNILSGFSQEGTIEAEEFTQQLYNELKSTPQPCLVPFLKVPTRSSSTVRSGF